MKIRSQSKSPIKLLAITGGVILVAALGWLYYAHHYQTWPFLPQATVEKPANTVDYSSPSEDQTKTGTSIKEQVAEQAKNSESASSSSTTSAPSVNMDITAANKTADTLMIRTLIQKVTTSGTCTLSMSGPSNGSYTASAGVQAMASTSTCQGFNVPLGGLAHGAWTITISFKDGTDTAVATKDITL